MFIDEHSSEPIFIQIADNIKEEIILGHLNRHDRVYSTNDLVALLGVNPATALKGLNILIDDQILYKKRGVGMFVSENAKAIILQQKMNDFQEKWLLRFVRESKKIGITLEELKKLVDSAYGEESMNENKN